MSSPSTNTSTSGSLEMTRRLDALTAGTAGPKLAVTFTCCPATTVTVWRHGCAPSLRTSTTWSPAGTPAMMAGAASFLAPSR